MQNSYKTSSDGAHADGRLSAAAAVDNSIPAADIEQQGAADRGAMYTSYGGGLAGPSALAGQLGPASDSPGVSEVVVLEDNPGEAAGKPAERLSPSPDADDDLGQYTSDPAAAQRTAAQHAGQGQSTHAGPVGDEGDAAPTPLPPPAFDLLRQPAAPSSGGRGHEQESMLQQLSRQLQPHLFEGATAGPTSQRSSGPQHSQASDAAAAAAATAAVGPAGGRSVPAAAPAPSAGGKRDHASELTQLLADLPAEEVLAVLRQLKAGNSPDSHGPSLRAAPSNAAERQQHQPIAALASMLHDRQQQQQYGLQPSAPSAPAAIPSQRATLLPPTLSAPVGPSSQTQGLAAVLAGTNTAPAGLQAELQAMQSGPLGPVKQQRLAPPRFIPEAECQAMAEVPLADQLQRVLQQGQPQQQPRQQQQQQQGHTDLQFLAHTISWKPPPTQQQQQNHQALDFPVLQQLQQQGSYRDSRPSQVQVPPAPAQPGMQATAADILQVMQRLIGAESNANSSMGELLPSQAAAPAAPAAAQPQMQSGDGLYGLPGGYGPSYGPPPPAPAAAPTSGIGSGGMGLGLQMAGRGYGPPPPLAAAAPPAPASGSGVDIAALMQQLMSVKHEPQPVQEPVLAEPAAPAALAQLPAALAQIPGVGGVFGAVVASAIAGITAGAGGSAAATSPGSKRLIEAAKDLLAALAGADAAPAEPPAATAAAGVGGYGQADAFDPVAAAAAPRDVPMPHKQQRHSGSGHPVEWGHEAGTNGDRGWGRGSSHGGARGDEGSGYFQERDHHAGRGGRSRERTGRRKARGRPSGSTAGAAAAGADGKSNLFALLAALEQQESGDFADAYDERGADEGHSYDAAAAAARDWEGADSDLEQAVSSSGQQEVDGYGEEGVHGRRGINGEQRRARVPPLAAALKARRRRAHGHVDPDPEENALHDQRWLLQQREGKRPVKPNDAFASYVAPVLPDEQQKRARHKPHHAEPRGARDLGYNPLDAAALAAMPSTFIDGPNHPRRYLKRRRTSYGWYLLGKGRLQQIEGEDEADAADIAPRQMPVIHRSAARLQETPQHSNSSGAGAAAGGAAAGGVDSVPVRSARPSVSAAAGGADVMAYESLSEAEAAAAAIEAAVAEQEAMQAQYEATGGEVDLAEASGSTAVGAGGERDHYSKKGWMAAPSWVTEDGVIVWPRDNEVTWEQRVFYIAYKWVHKYWPHRCGRDPLIATLPVALWLDGQPVELALEVKIRLYNKAAHLVINPYMDLARAYTGKWFTGYGYDARSNVIRVFLSTDRPDAPKQGHHAPKAAVAGKRGKGAAGRPRLAPAKRISLAKAAAAAAAAAGAEEPVTVSDSVAAPLTGGMGGRAALKTESMEGVTEDLPAAAAGGGGPTAAGSSQLPQSSVKGQQQQQQQQQAQQRSGMGSVGAAGRKRKQWPVIWGSVPADVLQEAAEHAAHPSATPAAADATAGPAAPAAPAAAAGGGEGLGSVQPDLKVLITHPAASEPGLDLQQQQQQQQQPVKRMRPSRSAAAGVAAAAIAAGAGGSPLAAAAYQGDPAVLKSLMRSQNCKAAVERRWAKYRWEKALSTSQVQQGSTGTTAAAPLAGTAAAAAAAGAAAGAASGEDVLQSTEYAPPQQQLQQQVKPTKPVLRLPELGGCEFAADIGTISTALVSVSDSMKLPEELLTGLSRQLVKALQAPDTAAAPKAAGGAVGASGDSVGVQLIAAVRGWYQQLRGAVSERNGAMVAQLVEELGSKVLAAAS